MDKKSYTHHYYYKEYSIYPADNSDDGDGTDDWGDSPSLRAEALNAYHTLCSCVDKCADDSKDLKTFENDKYGMYYDAGHVCTTTFTEKFYRTNDANAQIYVKVMHVKRENNNIYVYIKVYIDTTDTEYQFFFDTLGEYIKKESLSYECNCWFPNNQTDWHNQCLYEYNKY